MKKTLFTLFFVCLAASAMADQVENPKAGSLSTVLDIDATQAVISGPLNGTDILYLRTMLLDHKLTTIDMGEARIVAGGKPYSGSLTTTADVLGESMFAECSKLTSIVLPKGLKRMEKLALTKCTRLKEIVIPDSVSEVGMDCLAYNSALRKVTVGHSVGSFGQGVFWSDGSLADLYMYPEYAPNYGVYFLGSKPKVHIHPDSEKSYKNAWKDLGVTFVTDLVDSTRIDKSALAQDIRVFFTDDLCTELTPDCQAMSDDELLAALSEKKIPATLQNMVLKIKNNSWEKYEKQFRIQSYQPFSDANIWRDKVKASGLSFMGNPTGILGRQGNELYIFVGDDIPADATLFLNNCYENNLISSPTSGFELSKGLNIFKANLSESLFYVVYTVKTDNMKKMVSDYPHINIHIEGGEVNGYYDPTHASDEEYQYLRDHATGTYFTIKGRHSLWNFETETYKKVWPKTIDNSINWSDKQCMWQFELMGLCDDVAAGKLDYPPYNVSGGESLYPSYCNNPIFSIQGDPEDAGWANSSTYRTSYNGIDCIRASYDLENPDFDCWCVAHETGHNDQSTINLEICTEASNNLYSNVAIYLTGYLISKGTDITFEADDFNSNSPWVKRRIDSKMRMYYQLYLYYHMARHNTSFYPELMKALRKDPLKLFMTNNQSTMKFALKCCEIANEDLTDFFEAWGFFVPCNKLEVEDYGSKIFTLTQRDIDNTKKKMSQYPRKNHEILFIEDRIEPTYRFDIWSTNDHQERKGYVRGEYGELGHFTDYMDSVAGAQPTHYAAAIVRDTVFVSGEGGVGFAAYNADGSLRAFSNTRKLFVPNALNDTAWTAYSVTANGTLCPLEELSDEHSDEVKSGLMKSVLNQAAYVLALDDPEHEVVGFYHHDDLLNLSALYQEAYDRYLHSDKGSYVKYVHALTDELGRLNTLDRIPFEVDKDYVIKAARQPYYFSFNLNKRQIVPIRGVNYRDKTKRFYFQVADEKAGTYYIGNRQREHFVVNAPEGSSLLVANTSDPVPFVIEERSLGIYAFRPVVEKSDLYVTWKSASLIATDEFDTSNSLWILLAADEATSVSQPMTDNDEAESTIYDLSGRRVNADALTKGIYIVNGRKVMIK